MIETDNYSVDTLSQRRNGIYYTPPTAARVMASWAVRSDGIKILEPCFGSGVFLTAIKQVATAQLFTSIQVSGVEIMEVAHKSAVDIGLLEDNRAILGDFLDVNPFPVDAVIGNPPYVRLRSLPEHQLKQSLRITKEALGDAMDSSGSVWMAFVIHSIRFLKKGGRIALVLPYEFTHVRYARSLWTFLGNNFGAIRIARVKERLFPELLQQTIILFADNYGAKTSKVDFEAYHTTQSLAESNPVVKKQIILKDIIEGKRPFLRSLLSDELTELLENKLASLTAPVSDYCTFNIGYVSGNKDFFHPERQTISRYNLPSSSLRETLASSRELRNTGIFTSAISTDNIQKLFYPKGSLSAGEKQYIELGEQRKVNLGYKCSRRTPWYKVPDVRVPNFILSVFKERPSLIANDRGLAASNSLLCGFLHQPFTSDQFIAAWYTSFTLLSCELMVHSLGGGVLVMIPGEVSKVRIAMLGSLLTNHMSKLDSILKSAKGNAYAVGDGPVLIESLKLTANEVELIREGTRILAKWRVSANSEEQFNT